ncbi:MAG: RDD family protein [Woeseiaceae bacterium]|tara:strand:+ start:268 stop:681 length:414 start_codon:yes stop_codon:yes gene_type:complete
MSNVNLKRRFMSIIYDSLLILSIMVIGTLPFIAIRYGEAVESNSNYYQFTLFIIIYFFLVGFWSISGRTLGMQSWGLRLETLDGYRPNIIQCSIRFFAAIVSWLPFGLGFWWQLFDKQNLTWHDRISKTKIFYYPRN